MQRPLTFAIPRAGDKQDGQCDRNAVHFHLRLGP
jgi:hypothetical protein